MGVQLNIKDQRTVALASELSEATGRSGTETIRAALEAAKRLRAEEIADRIRHVNAIADEIHGQSPPEIRGLSSKEIMDSIYDDGLPI